MKVSENVFPQLVFEEGAAPATPDANQVILYAKSDGRVYAKDDTGVEVLLSLDRRTITEATSASNVLTVDCSLGDYFFTELTENITTLDLTDVPVGRGVTIVLQITQDATARTFAWPASFLWPAGAAGAISTAAGAIDLLTMTTYDGGTTWMVTLAKGFA